MKMRTLNEGEYVDHVKKLNDEEYFVYILLDGKAYSGIVEQVE